MELARARTQNLPLKSTWTQIKLFEYKLEISGYIQGYSHGVYCANVIASLGRVNAGNNIRCVKIRNARIMHHF